MAPKSSPNGRCHYAQAQPIGHQPQSRHTPLVQPSSDTDSDTDSSGIPESMRDEARRMVYLLVRTLQRHYQEPIQFLQASHLGPNVITVSSLLQYCQIQHTCEEAMADACRAARLNNRDPLFKVYEDQRGVFSVMLRMPGDCT